MRFHHVKLQARDIDVLAGFYEEALGCEPVTPTIDVEDEAVARAIGAPGSSIRLRQLRLPGGGESGAILELYSLEGGVGAWDYHAGQGQLAFVVADVDQAAERIIAAGGSRLGEISDWVTSSGTFRFVYLRDPEGNIVDLATRVE